MTRLASSSIPKKSSLPAVSKHLACILPFCLYLASPVVAEPVVTGNVISWPDNGWYQVQNAETYNPVCEGGSQCEVSGGTYIVINHSNGERWNSVVVNSSVVVNVDTGEEPARNPSATVTVEGTTIRWPDNGWYQVQSALTYLSVCEGGFSCQVEPGAYTVINLTTGERFENIVAGSAATQISTPDEAATPTNADFNSRTDSWIVEGNTLQFQTTDWFQVQTTGYPIDFQTVCEGESTCLLEDGFYQIVNHSSGEVWQRVRINTTSGNLRWRQTDLNRGDLYWTHVIYNYTPNTFNVYLNAELYDTTSRASATLSGLMRGTRYHIEVYANTVDGTEELVDEIEIVTDGPAADLVSYGRPAGDRDTFGFELWDTVPDAVVAELPSDCLFAIPAAGYCYSPSTRYLIGYNYAEIDWEFTLPGDNSTNNIEALVHFYGSGGRNGALKEMALVTDVSTLSDPSNYEISVFRGSGTFQGTYPILQDIRFSNSTGVERQINLDGSDLQVTIGPLRPFDYYSPYVRSAPQRLHIAGEYYEPNGNGVASDLSGWMRMGAFLAVVDSRTGQTISQTFYPGLRMQDVPEPD